MDREMLTEETVIGKKRDKGVTTIEYAIMLVLIAIAIAIAAPNISSAVLSVFSRTASVIS